jgi:Tfp pilus assembly protein PilF
MLEMANRLMKAGQPSEAANVLSALTSMPGASAEALVLHIRALAAAGRDEEAMIARRKAIAAGVAENHLR